MKRSIIVFFGILSVLLLLTSCAKKTDNELDLIVSGTYVMQNCEEPLAPQVVLNTENGENTFSFMYSSVSSYIGQGSFYVKELKLYLNTDDGKNTYCFSINENNLIFDAAYSSTIPEFDGFTTPTDGAIFSLSR